MNENHAAEMLIKRRDMLKSARVNFDDTWQQVSDLVWPEQADFTYRRSPGEKRTERIYEMTAAQALERGSAAMEAFHTPRTNRWHRLVASNEDLNRVAEVKRWFEQATDLLFRWRNAPVARFYGEMHLIWKSELAFGNACLFVEERPQGGTAYRQIHIGRAWMELNHEGVVDTVYREYDLTAKAAVQRWGKKAPQCARNCVDEEPFKKHCYLTVVRPNDKHEPGIKTSKPFEVLEISVDDKTILERGGYFEMPYIWARYSVSPHETYGRGPAMLVLPDIQTLQEMQKTFMRSGHKVADPPLLVADDGVLGRGSKQIRLTPGGVTVGGVDTEGRAKVIPLQTRARLDITEAMMEQLRGVIREAFHVDLHDLLVRDRVQMTATEVLERAREKGMFLTPIVGRNQNELLGPLIDREIKIAMRQGKLGPMPDELIEAEGEYEIEYESSATRMQNSDSVLGISRAADVMMPWIQANPTLLEVWKAPDTIRYVNDTLGVPSKLVHTEEEYEDIEAATAEAAQQQVAAEQAPAQAKAVSELMSVGGRFG